MQNQSLGPTVRQAGRLYLLLLVLLLGGSVVLMPYLGIGGNLWVNELGYILLPVLLLAWSQRWQWREVFRLKPISGRLFFTCFAAGAVLWLFTAVLFSLLESWTNQALGQFSMSTTSGSVSLSQALLFGFGVVVLAPICEEVFFRGFMQRAMEAYGGLSAYVITGVLFGAMHILNGMNNLLPATLLGLALGYLAYRTGSLWPSVALHMGTNLMSRFGVAIWPGLATGGVLPSWLFGLAALSALVGLWLLRRIGRMHPVSDIPPRLGARKLTRSISLWLAALLLLATLGSEVALRAGWLDGYLVSATPDSSFSCAEFSDSLVALSVDVAATDLGSQAEFSYEFDATEIDTVMMLQNPQGETVWSQDWKGSGLKVQSGNLSVPLTSAGTWKLLLRGEGKGLEMKVFWKP